MSDLTIVIPSFNRSHLLEKTLDSFTLQVNRSFRIALIDHGSDDNTREIVEKYQNRLAIDYYFLSRDGFSPGTARDFGMRQVKTPTTAFLDSGMIVPSFYVAAHIAFHRLRPRHVGVGLCYGHLAIPPEERLLGVLGMLELDRADEALSSSSDFCDIRKLRGLHRLEDTRFPWFFSWSGNLSLPTESYWQVGGFDLDHKGWGFEDLDISYRLWKKGYQFSYVDDGWAIHLPHPHEPHKDNTEKQNCQRTYWKQRSLALEMLLYSSLDFEKAEKCFDYWQEIQRNRPTFPPLSGLVARYALLRPVLLIGGTARDFPGYDYIALGDEKFPSNSHEWSCSGILIPLEDHSLQTVVVSEIWQRLGRSFNDQNLTLLECLITEIKRTARRAIFVASSSQSAFQENHVTVEELEHLCQRCELSFQLVTLE
jgi:glycosyltransferase involved in cell wall biosynthesis